MQRYLTDIRLVSIASADSWQKKQVKVPKYRVSLLLLNPISLQNLLQTYICW